MDVRTSWRGPVDALKTATDRLRAKPKLMLLALAGASALLSAIVLLWLTAPRHVQIASVTRGEAVDIVYGTGIVDFVREADVAPVVVAPILRVFVEEGQSVRAGALLSQLEDAQQQATLRQLEAQAALARIEARRAEQLYARDFASRASLDDARAQRNAASAAAAAQRALTANYAVRAPFAGEVIRRDAEPGDLASPSHPLFVIADRSRLRVTADLDERDVARVARGQRALIRADAFAGESFEARVAELTPQGDAGARVFRVRLSLASDTPLRPGMNVEANIVTAVRENALLVPSNALREGAVWTVVNGHARRRVVETGASGAERTEIKSGLAAGDVVIIDPPAGLRDGVNVRVERARS